MPSQRRRAKPACRLDQLFTVLATLEVPVAPVRGGDAAIVVGVVGGGKVAPLLVIVVLVGIVIGGSCRCP